MPTRIISLIQSKTYLICEKDKGEIPSIALLSNYGMVNAAIKFTL